MRFQFYDQILTSVQIVGLRIARFTEALNVCSIAQQKLKLIKLPPRLLGKRRIGGSFFIDISAKHQDVLRSAIHYA
jgi:hypothetical protein